MLHRIKAQYLSIVLLLGAVLCLAATMHLVMTSGQLAYFVAFHAPFHIQPAVSPATQPPLPGFNVRHEISQARLSPAGTQTIRITVIPQQTIRAYLEIWVRGPNNREVYKYPADVDSAPLQQFVAGRPQVFDETYVLPSNAPSGTYRVSASIVSVNQHVDYYQARNFASFEAL